MKKEEQKLILAVLIVLYRKASQDSVALQSLLAQKVLLDGEGIDLQVHVWNNSPGLAQPSPGARWYEADNQSLSAIYNHVAADAFANGVELFMISDDDTNYSNVSLLHCLEQIEQVRNSADGNQIGVYLPRMMSNNQLVSPGSRWLFKGRLTPSARPGVVPSKNLLGINSGLIFTKACFEKMLPFYDERLRFYATDSNFFIRYEKVFPKAYLLDVTIAHDLSEHSADTPARALFRFEEMVRGLRISFESHSLAVQVLLNIYLSYAAVRKALAYRRPSFLKALFFNREMPK
ncbi:hypothetical protein PPTS312_18170 [Pseudomonas putida]|uniref:Glycosyltransferase n=1 Tax=Pseudomonas putida TaxID=303 RepID=A0A7U6RBC6_PSEPU|nr:MULTISPECIES: hypothetical protein [Pseudomonas putida group]MDD2123125.1 hypothetical protein [Pseudomonas monteilii]BBU43902.1 hypothetical protein PPTS312_18170 [Pseudomonas putida]